jgi:TolB-like protein
MRRFALAFICCGAVLLGCAESPGVKNGKQSEPPKRSILFLTAEVLKVEGDAIAIRLQKPAPLKTEGKLASALAQGVIDTCYLLEGREILLNQTRVKVTQVTGDDAKVRAMEKAPPLKAGDKVVFPLERKRIAVKDFEVIVGRNKEAARFVQEDVESLLVESGQFSVVERAKLGSLLEEIQLGQTGAIDPATAQKAGKLLGAEIILTGTLAASGNEWNVNLRLVNTETGLIIAAIRRIGALNELRAEAFREIKNMDGSFESEGAEFAGWIVGTMMNERAGKGGYQKVYIDKTEGADGTKQSIAMTFKLGSARVREHHDQWIQAHLRNQLKRDLGKYTGIRFFIKGSDDFTIRFQLNAGGRTQDDEEAKWFKNIIVTKRWEEFQFSFTSLSATKVKPSKKAARQHYMDLTNVDQIQWGADERYMPLGTEGTIWVDEVSFY